MIFQIIQDNIDRDLFNNKSKHPLQTWEWGQVRKNTGVKIVRIGEYINNNLVDVFTMTLHKVPFTHFYIGYIPRSSIPSPQLLQFIHNYGLKNNIVFVKIEPNEKATDENFRKISQINKPGLNLNLQASTHPLFPSWTQILDLSKPEDLLLKQMKPKTRYNIGYAQKKGVIVEEQTNDKGFEIFSKLYFSTTTRQSYKGHDLSYHHAVWEGMRERYAHILIASYNSKPLAAYELFVHHDHIYYPYGGSSLENKGLMASNLLMWHAILLGKKLQANILDMWGSLPPNYNHEDKWSGFTRFKEGYGTLFTQFIGSYDLIIRPKLFGIYNIANTFRSKLL